MNLHRQIVTPTASFSFGLYLSSVEGFRKSSKLRTGLRSSSSAAERVACFVGIGQNEFSICGRNFQYSKIMAAVI